MREGELAVDLPEPRDAGLIFIGRIRTPWTDRMSCPRQGRQDGPVCRLELFEPWTQGLPGLSLYKRVEVLYWLDQSRRATVPQLPKPDGNGRGVFPLRPPVRPNPIGFPLQHWSASKAARFSCAASTAWTERR